MYVYVEAVAVLWFFLCSWCVYAIRGLAVVLGEPRDGCRTEATLEDGLSVT